MLCQLKSIKVTCNQKFSSVVTLAEFQGLNSHMWSVATIWDTSPIHHYRVLLDSAVLDKILNEGGPWKKYSLNTSGSLLIPLTKPPTKH